jgi:hypothetical protein
MAQHCRRKYKLYLIGGLFALEHGTRYTGCKPHKDLGARFHGGLRSTYGVCRRRITNLDDDKIDLIRDMNEENARPPNCDRTNHFMQKNQGAS